MQVEETLQCVPNIRIVIENTNDFSLVGHDAEMPQALLAEGWGGQRFSVSLRAISLSFGLAE